jgi:N-acetylneuraminic acid mutarotase
MSASGPNGRRKFLVQVTAAGAALCSTGFRSQLRKAEEGILRIGPWQDLPPQPIGLAAHFSWWDGERLMAAGGSYWEGGKKHFVASIWSYLKGDEIWFNAGKLPRPVGYMVGMTFEHRPFIFGGSKDNQAVSDCYEVSVNHKTRIAESQPLPSLPTPLDCAGGALVASRAMLVGGAVKYDDVSTYGEDFLWYDLKSKGAKWTKGPVFPGPARCLPAVTSLSDSLFVFGGFRFEKPNTLRNLDDAYVYSARSDSWKRIAKLPFPLRSAGACSYGERYILLIGGAGNEPAQPARFKTVLVYDVIEDSYAELRALPHSVSVPYATVKDDHLYIVGGEPPDGNRVSRVISSSIQVGRK